MIRITKDFGTFDAAHVLPNHAGLCRNCHGHSYRVEVTVSGDVNTDPSSESLGMVIDFSILKDIFDRRIKSRLDHSLMLGTAPVKFIQTFLSLNNESHRNPETEYDPGSAANLKFLNEQFGKVVVLPIPTTTAENLADWMAGQFFQEFQLRGLRCNIYEVKVWETPTSYACWSSWDR